MTTMSVLLLVEDADQEARLQQTSCSASKDEAGKWRHLGCSRQSERGLRR